MEKRIVTLEEMHQLQLLMLDNFHEFCMRNGLRYSLGGGTLLGAVRHKGFIPWDNDADIMMPRPDYDRFVKEYEGYCKYYKIQHQNNTKRYHLLFAKIYDCRTTLVQPGLVNGVFIDVFAIDGLPDWNEIPKFYNRFCKLKYSLRFYYFPWRIISFKDANLATYTKRFISNCKEICFKLLHFYRFVVPIKKRVREIDEMLHLYNFDTSNVAGCITGAYGKKEIMDAYVFKHYVEIDFAGRKYQAIAAHDAYLTQHYGDYMQLPIEEKRFGHQNFECWWNKKD